MEKGKELLRGLLLATTMLRGDIGQQGICEGIELRVGVIEARVGVIEVTILYLRAILQYKELLFYLRS